MAGSEADSVREKQDISRPKVFKSAPGSSVVHDICFVIVDLLKDTADVWKFDGIMNSSTRTYDVACLYNRVSLMYV